VRLNRLMARESFKFTLCLIRRVVAALLLLIFAALINHSHQTLFESS